MKIITLETNSATYPIYIGDNILQQNDILQSHIKGSQILIVTQKNIAQYFLNSLAEKLKNFQIQFYFLPEGEEHKTFREYEKLLGTLIENKYDRSVTLLALGGGMVGDITGFAAATYMRGVNYIQIPTTLLAQTDSAIGGKTGVNHALGKNIVGVIYHPQCVVVDIALLKTLPKREFISGLAEVIKYALIRDANLFQWLEANKEKIIHCNHDVVVEMIYFSLKIKSEIVAQDEKDYSIRNLLNFGHTFGHALETILDYKKILHGEAVAIGMILAAKLSAELNLIAREDVDRIQKLLSDVGLPYVLPTQVNPEELILQMQRDKKNANGELNLILLQKIGSAFKKSNVCKNEILKMFAKKWHDIVVPL